MARRVSTDARKAKRKMKIAMTGYTVRRMTRRVNSVSFLEFSPSFPALITCRINNLSSALHCVKVTEPLFENQRVLFSVAMADNSCCSHSALTVSLMGHSPFPVELFLL